MRLCVLLSVTYRGKDQDPTLRPCFPVHSCITFYNQTRLTVFFNIMKIIMLKDRDLNLLGGRTFFFFKDYIVKNVQP